jgi:hypothetical protein
MRTNARSLPALASALLLAASGATVSCCCAGKVPIDGAKGFTSNPAIVIVSYDAETGKAWMSETDKNLELWEPNDIVKWISAYGTVHIVPDGWKPKLPFRNHPAPDPADKKVLRGGPPSSGSGTHGGIPCMDHTGKIKAQCYDYTAWLWLDADGKEKVKIDPRIVVMP